MAKRPLTATADKTSTAAAVAEPPVETNAMVPVKGKPGMALVPQVETDPENHYERGPSGEPDLEQWARNETYAGLSERPVTEAQAKALLEPVRDDELLIKPDQFGAVYLSHPGYRRRLNAAFRPGGWGLRRLSPFNFEESTGMLFAEYGLYAEGRFLAAATGEQKYLAADGTNDQMTKGDAIEGCRSNALMRCCKDLGMAMECWDKDFTDRWRAKYCFRVWKNSKPAWRRMTDPPMFKETGITDDSPNRDKYQAPPQREDRRGGSSQPAGRGESFVDRATDPSRPAPGGQSGGERKGNPTAKINDKQKKFFWSVVKQQGMDADDVATYLKASFGITKSDDMTNEQMDKALAWVRSAGD